MGRCAAIGVDDYLAAGQASVTVRAADFKAAGRVDVIDRVAQQDRRNNLGHNLAHISVQFRFLVTRVITRGMLRRHDNSGGGDWQAAFVAQGNLALCVWFKERGYTGMAVSGHTLQNLVAVIERCRHQIGRFVGRIAKHDALIASAFILVAGCINTLCDLDGLAVQIVFKAECFPMETILLVTDFFHGAANGGFDFFLRAGCPCVIFIDAFAADFTGKHDQLSRGQGFARDAGFGVFGKK